MAASSANTEDVKLNRVRLGRSSNWDYVHRCVAMVMGMGSLWRFPMLAYEQGRGAFLICYLIMTFLLAMPLCQIEIALAQFSGSSIKALWKCMPLGRGIGVAGCFCAALVSVYQALVVAYAATYLGDSVLYPQLPWTACGPAWGADAACYGLADAQLLCGRTARLPVYLMSGLLGSRGPDSEPLLKFPAMPVNDTLRCKNATLPSSEQFFYKRVLALSPSIGDFGHLRPDLIAYLCAVWLTTFFHVCGAAKFFGKVSLAVVPFCYGCTLMVMTRLLLLDNAVQGLRYLFSFEWESFANLAIWHQAAQHSVFNLGTWFGPLHYLSSRNDFYLDTRFSHVFLAVNAVLYNMAGSVMTFSAMGHMAALRGSPTVPDAERPERLLHGPPARRLRRRSGRAHRRPLRNRCRRVDIRSPQRVQGRRVPAGPPSGQRVPVSVALRLSRHPAGGRPQSRDELQRQPQDGTPRVPAVGERPRLPGSGLVPGDHRGRQRHRVPETQPGCQGSGQATLHVGTKGSSASGRLQETPQYLPATATFQSVSRPKYKHAEDRLPAGIELTRHFRFREQLSSKEGATTMVVPLSVAMNVSAHLQIWCSACARSSFFLSAMN
ncbi:sodium-dependent acetylcholine transporter-like isoform X2 [Dermacentor albipictus]|uniref:sodium-dependent acetylcholine transporter-like isoform X2 n=1 Tax=Dermacentor albipictus TaxID=60249 RepID=UPI0038FC1ACA